MRAVARARTRGMEPPRQQSPAGVFPRPAHWTSFSTLEPFATASEGTRRIGCRCRHSRDRCAPAGSRAIPRERCAHGPNEPRRERQGRNDRRRSRHALALCVAQRARAQQPAFRLRSRAVRRLHGARRRPTCALLRDAGVGGRQQQDRHAGRPRHAGKAAPHPEGLCRGAGAAMRLLHQRLDHDGGRVPQPKQETDRRADQGGARRSQVPLRHPHEHPARGQARGGDDGLREAIMTKMDNTAQFSVSRRALLKAGGALVVSIGAAVPLDTALAAGEALAQGAKPPLMPDQLASFIAVNADGTVSAFFGKMDRGQGLCVAIGQMVAEELDVPFKAVKVIMGDTATSVNQGGASGSTGIQLGGKQMRAAAAEARRVLVEMAATKLGLPADQLTVTDGVVQGKNDAAKKASYAELIGGRYFNVQLDWNKEMGNTLYAPGKAKPKDPKDYKIVGKPIAREDIAPKVYAQEDFCTDVKLPGMVHGRMIRPAVAGSVPVKVDENSIKDIPGAKVVWEKGFLGVVADKEWGAIKAAEKLKVEWSDAKPPFPDQAALYDHIRSAQVRKREIGGREVGNVDDAFKTAARVVEAEYEWPFQSHACMGPACAMAEVKDGNVTCWTGSQKPHFVKGGIALSLG